MVLERVFRDIEKGTVAVIVGAVFAGISFGYAYLDAWWDAFTNPWLRSASYQSMAWWNIFTTNHYWTLVYINNGAFFYEVSLGSAIVVGIIGAIIALAGID